PSVLRPHPAPTALSPLSLHDALPIFPVAPHCTADGGGGGWWLGLGSSTPAAPSGPSPEPKPKARRRAPARLEGGRGGDGNRATRSEEHTSELQSPTQLLCPLPLVKKQ